MHWGPGGVLRTTTRSDASHACGGRDGELDRGGGRVSATGERATGCGELGGEEEEVQGAHDRCREGPGKTRCARGGADSDDGDDGAEEGDEVAAVAAGSSSSSTRWQEA